MVGRAPSLQLGTNSSLAARTQVVTPTSSPWYPAISAVPRTAQGPPSNVTRVVSPPVMSQGPPSDVQGLCKCIAACPRQRPQLLQGQSTEPLRPRRQQTSRQLRALLPGQSIEPHRP